MFSNERRCEYSNNQLAEVICQLRFPEILTIGTTVPADFQEAICMEFPQYAAKSESGFAFCSILRKFHADCFLKIRRYCSANRENFGKTQLTDHLCQLVVAIFASSFIREHRIPLFYYLYTLYRFLCEKASGQNFLYKNFTIHRCLCIIRHICRRCCFGFFIFP